MTARRDRRGGRGSAFMGGGSFIPLSLTALSPDIGFSATAGATAPFLLTATGGPFLGTESFTIGGIAVGSPTFINATTVTFFAPTLGGTGDYDVVATRGAQTATLTAYYRCQQMLNWTRADVGTGASWTDLSGNARHFVQAVGASQPVFSASTINSLPGFVGNATTISTLAPTAINSATHATYIVQRSDTNGGGNEGIRALLGVAATADNNSPNSGVAYRGGTNIAEFSSPNVLCSTAGPINGVAGLIEDIYDGANQFSRVNATTGTPVAQTATMNIDRINLWSRWLGGVPALWYAGTICEFMFGALPSAAIRTRIRTRLANRYNQANFI